MTRDRVIAVEKRGWCHSWSVLKAAPTRSLAELGLEVTKEEESRVTSNNWKNDMAIYSQSEDYKMSESGGTTRSSLLVMWTWRHLPDGQVEMLSSQSAGYASLESGKMGWEVEIWKLSVYRWCLNCEIEWDHLDSRERMQVERFED